MESSSVDTFDCTVRELSSFRNKDRRTSTEFDLLQCVSDDYSSSVTLDGDIKAFFGKHSYKLGVTKLSIPVSLITGDLVDLDSSGASAIRIFRMSARGNEHKTGTYKVLVVRVVDENGNAPSLSIAELGTKTFDDTLNLVSTIEL